jgi:hypothetical protein
VGGDDTRAGVEIPKGGHVVVREVRGLTLVVDEAQTD